jgi:Flp pilus assembly protein TadG
MRSPRNTARRKNQKGANILESALVLLTMLGMILFIMDMGRILLIQQFITERARAAVRSAVVNNWTATATKNYLVYNSTTAPNGGGAGFLGLQTSNVTYQTLGTSGTPDYMIQVKVSGIQAITWIPYISGAYTLAPITFAMPAQSLGATN